MNYQDALNYIYSFLDSEAKLPRLPAEFNLPRTVALLRACGDPQREFRSVVVAGTKGKGSTSVMLESILRHAGLRTGLWTSPHLHSYRERIQLGREPIGQELLVAQVERLRPIFDRFDIEQFGTPSVFDIGFVIALDLFARSQVEVAVLEVGLGGRYDCANAVPAVLSVITSISYDHMHVLGHTLAEIAYQKAGIAKSGVPLLALEQAPEAMQAIAKAAGEAQAPLYTLPRAGDSATPQGPRPLSQPYAGPIRPALQGSFQRENARLAVAAAALLREQCYEIADEAIDAGLASAWWPARFEVVAGDPTYVIDGAHNGDSAARLLEALRAQFGGSQLVLVFGTTQDKDVARMFDTLIPAADALVLTHSRHPRADTHMATLAEAARQRRAADAPLETRLTDDIPKALAEARTLARPGAVICITGSLFVAAAAREALGLPHQRD
ncbi:bifunctional folylpolyglutamate synthase/dihydrofolate synthase [Chloroflexia bacterium SDU3-3]|nr:bifunctional folylpolyglutamate synthase/dihydrofolate synthase [Chloroflexia bacterium SDU3-3]